MIKKSFTKGVLLGIEILSFVFFLQGNLTLAGAGFIVAGIWAAATGLNGADVQILLGILVFQIASQNRFLFIITCFLLIFVAIYYMIQLHQIRKIYGKEIDKDKWFKLFYEKQLVNVLLRKLKRIQK